MTANFEFTPENLAKAQEVISKYPTDRKKSAIMALLDLAQRQNNNYLNREAIEYIASFLNLLPIRVYEVASFYSMYNLKPVGKYFIQICGTTPCMLKGSAEVTEACREILGINLGETSKDNLFTLKEVECLGACVNAPVVQINDDYYEDLDPKIMKQIIQDLKDGKSIKIGSQIGRKSSEPV